MGNDRQLEIDIADMKETALPVGPARTGRQLTYTSGGTLRMRNDQALDRSITPNSALVVVGPGGDYTTLTAAIAAVGSGTRIKLMIGTYTGDITFTKRIFIEGEGSQSIIDGNLIFDSGSDYSYITNCNLRQDITFNIPSQYINVVFNWISSTTVISDFNIVTSVSTTYRLFALVSQTFDYYASASTTQQTFAEFTGNVATQAASAGTYDTYASITVTTDTVASANTTVSTYANATTVFSAYAKATRVSNTFAIGDTTYEVRAIGSTLYDVIATANTTYATRATVATTSETLSTGSTTFSTFAFGNYSGVTFTADFLGTIGNSISLAFDGIEDIDTVVANWNAGNVGNTVSHNGVGTDVLPLGNVNLFAGSTANAVNFTAVTPGVAGDAISLTFNGTTDTLDAVVTAWNGANPGNQVSHDGNPNGVPVGATTNLTGGSSGNVVTLEAITPGISGNAISIPFDGVTDLSTTIANWNAGNPTQTVTYTGIATSIVPAGTQNLSGATGGNAVTFTAVTPGAAGNGISLNFDGSQDIDTVVAAWNGANGANQVIHNGLGTGIVAPSTVNLSGGVSAATANFSAALLGTVGNAISLTFNGTTDTLTSVTAAWNLANAGNQVTFTGNAVGIPVAGTINLTGGTNSTAVRFQAVTSGTTGNTIVLPFDGTQTIQTVVANWNGANPTKTVSSTGPNAGVVPASTLTLAGGKNAASYTFTADVIGAGGNAISLVFDGINTLAYFVNDWNTNNPANTVTNTGVGTDILVAQTVTLANGVTDASVTFTADNLGPAGNTISLVFDGIQDISTVTNAWNAANALNTCSNNGNPLGIITPQTVNLGGAAGGVATTIVAVTPGTPGNLITLVFNGTTDTTTNVINAWNLANPTNQATEYGGTPSGVPAAGTIVLSGATDNEVVTFTADTLGAVGDSIVLNFDGGAAVSEVVTDWNIANPANTVTAIGSQTVLFPIMLVAPTGGFDAVAFQFVAVTPGPGGNAIVVVANGVDNLDTIVTAWNIANPANTISHDAVTGLGVPSAGTYTFATGSNATSVYFKATFAGVAGNAITLTFDGVQNVGSVTSAWNTANAGNTVGTTSPATLVIAAQVINLTGGSASVPVTFTATVPGTNGNLIALVMDGTQDVSTVVAVWNAGNPTNTVGYVGNPTGVVAAGTVTLTGGRDSVPVTFTADNLGTIGNVISLTFNGTTDTFNSVVNAWNTANPTNTCTHNAADGNYVPYAISLTLAGGLDDTPITFTSTGGPGFTLVFDGVQTVETVVDNWNALNPNSQATYDGKPGTNDGIVPASTVRLSVGGANNMYILTQE